MLTPPRGLRAPPGRPSRHIDFPRAFSTFFVAGVGFAGVGSGSLANGPETDGLRPRRRQRRTQANARPLPRPGLHQGSGGAAVGGPGGRRLSGSTGPTFSPSRQGRAVRADQAQPEAVGPRRPHFRKASRLLLGALDVPTVHRQSSLDRLHMPARNQHTSVLHVGIRRVLHGVDEKSAVPVWHSDLGHIEAGWLVPWMHHAIPPCSALEAHQVAPFAHDSET